MPTTTNYKLISQKQILSGSLTGDSQWDFASSIAINSLTKNFVCSSPKQENPGSPANQNNGVVYVFVTNSLGGTGLDNTGSYTEWQFLTYSGVKTDSSIVGSHTFFSSCSNSIYATLSSSPNAVLVYTRSFMDNKYWHEHQIVTGSHSLSFNQFPLHFSISPDGLDSYMIISAPGFDDTSNIPYMFVYGNSGNNYTWNQEQVLTNSVNRSGWGASCCINKNYLIVGGSPYETVSGKAKQGVVYVHRPINNPTLKHYQCDTIQSSDGLSGDGLGIQVYIDDNGFIAAGAENHKVGANDGQGAVYIFSQSSNFQWTQYQKLTASDGAANDKFGGNLIYQKPTPQGIKIFNDPKKTILITSCRQTSGKFYIFTQSGDYWHQHQVVTASQANNYLSVADGVINGIGTDFIAAGGVNNQVDGGGYLYDNLYESFYVPPVFAPPIVCGTQTIGSDFTINNLICLPTQHRKALYDESIKYEERVVTAPLFLNSPMISLRMRNLSTSSSLG
ncbi:MAG: FG-GAP repeat protein [Nanoarchaeota archaeon]|nr:FG-GAP repeat protein [Nanoarchaeota archaeon]